MHINMRCIWSAIKERRERKVRKRLKAKVWPLTISDFSLIILQSGSRLFCLVLALALHSMFLDPYLWKWDWKLDTKAKELEPKKNRKKKEKCLQQTIKYRKQIIHMARVQNQLKKCEGTLYVCVTYTERKKLFCLSLSLYLTQFPINTSKHAVISSYQPFKSNGSKSEHSKSLFQLESK